MKILFVAFAVVAISGTAHAACPLGTLAQGDTCVSCNTTTEPYYCPDENTRLPCPPHPDNAKEYYETTTGHTVTKLLGQWSRPNAYRSYDCLSDIELVTAEGNFYLFECPWNDTDYAGCARQWFLAGIGYYLSPYMRQSGWNFYYGVKACTNAPTHAHYTGPGTPDNADGTVKDANDCPWECDCGYAKNGNTCVAASECTAGVKTLRTGTGLVYKLYDTQTTSPTIAIGLNGNVCYACLAPGAAGGALNLEWADGIFHAINGE